VQPHREAPEAVHARRGEGGARLVVAAQRGEQHLRSRRLHRHGAAVHGRELGQRVGLALPGVRLVTSAAAYRLS
jgi:hypothetical protein